MSEDADAAQIPLPRWWQFRKRRLLAKIQFQVETMVLLDLVHAEEKRQLDARFAIIESDLELLQARLAAAEREVAMLPVILTAWAETIGKHLAQIEALASHHGKTGGDA